MSLYNWSADHPHYDTLSSMTNKWGTDLSLLCPERNPPMKAPAQERLQNPKLDCRVCGKLFKSKSSLKKHAVGHSQQRKHVCNICEKGFKRHDHLTGHMWTHLNPKPFACTELGCNKSYCGSRSLKRHVAFHHGQYTGNTDIAMDANHKEQPKSFSLLSSFSKVETVPSQPSFSNTDLIQNSSSQGQAVSNVGVPYPSERSVPLTVALNVNKVVPEYTCAALNSVHLNTYTFIKQVSVGPEAILYPVLDADCLGIQPKKAVTTNPEHDMFVSSAAGPLVQNHLNGQPVEGKLIKPVEKYVTTVGTSEETPLGDRNQKTLDIVSSTQQGSTQVTLLTYGGSQLQNQQPFIALLDLQPLLSEEQSQSHPILTNYHYLPVIITNTKERRCTNGEQMDALPKADTRKSCTQAAEQAVWSDMCDADSSPSSSIEKQKEQQLTDGLSNAFDTSRTDQNPGNHRQNSSLSRKLTVPADDTLSPSQVAMESFIFSPKMPDEKKNSEIAISKKFQKENTNGLPIEERGGTDTANRLSAAFDMMEMSDLGAALPSGSVEKSPSLYKGKKAQRRLLQDVPKGHSTYRKRKLSQQAPKPSKGMMKDPGGLVMPVSVPVTVIDHHEDNKVNEIRDHLQDPNTKKRKRSLPKPLYIPPPLLDVKSSPTGCFRSNFRSLNTDLYEDFRYPTYIPPPMLSPIRPGSGLYFNTFCSPSSATGPNFSFPEKETSPCEILPVKDSMVFTTQPRVNIGNQFQADIPEIQDPCSLGDSKADLVWKPLKMTKSVTNFLHLACSSAVPGGGNNLEFALHCLHLSRGNTMEALDKLLIQDPYTYFPRYLADYHYAGSYYWSDSEKQLFRKAYRNNGKEFSYIQAMIPKKNIYQCVEYYYTWKKHITFEKRGTSAAENTSSFDGRESECNKNDGLSGNKTTVFTTGFERDATLQHTGRHQRGKKKFSCGESDRIFNKIKSIVDRR